MATSNVKWQQVIVVVFLLVATAIASSLVTRCLESPTSIHQVPQIISSAAANESNKAGQNTASSAAASSDTTKGALPDIAVKVSSKDTTRDASDKKEQSDQEHLIKVQEAVLDNIEKMEQKAIQQQSFAITTIGYIGALVLIIFAYLGFNTQKDTRTTLEKSEVILKEMTAKKTDMELLLNNAEAELKKIRNMVPTFEKKTQEALNAVEKAMQESMVVAFNPAVTYISKMAELNGSNWKSYSFEQQIEHCEAAEKAISALAIDEKHKKEALSFVLAMKGVAYLNANKLLEAEEILKRSIILNVKARPDRHYNLACVLAKMVPYPGGEKRVTEAVAQLEACKLMTGSNVAPAPVEQSKEYARMYAGLFGDTKGVGKDIEFDALRDKPEFEEWLKTLPKPTSI